MRAASLLALAALVLAGCTIPLDRPASPARDAAPQPPGDALLREDWTNESGWVASGGGARRECPVGGEPCSLVVDAACCGYLKVRRDLDAPLPERFAASWRFVPGEAGGREDSNVVLYLAEDVGVTVTHTDGDALRLYSTGHGSARLPVAWTPGEWHEARVLADAAADEARVELRGPAGQLLARSEALRLPDAPRVLRAVAFEAIDEAGNSPGFRYGPLVVEAWDGRLDDGGPLLDEAWDAGLQGWYVTGKAARVACGPPDGCVLEARPCCPEYLYVRRALDAPLPERLEASFRFRAATLESTGDASFVLYFAPRVGVTVTMTVDGPQGNSGMRLYSTGHGEADFGAWPAAGAWHEVRILLDRGEGTARAELRDAEGALLGRSDALRLPAESARLLSVSFESVAYGAGAGFDYDDVRVASAAS